jgi:uncharacterized protein YprB with RNaseH-like and TPR domain
MNKFDFLDRFNKNEKLDIDRLAVEEFAEQTGGELVRTESGRYLEIVTDYVPDHKHGARLFSAALGGKQFNLGYFEINEQERTINLEDIVFVDAETTGLSAAAGTVAFLLGVGYVRDDRFRLHQFFLPDYPDEPAMLEAIADLVDKHTCVCTFNGKCFDLPLLETRYIMQRSESPFSQMDRIDLLHSSRRFWRGRFADTTLQTLEKELLGLYRYDDTPGYMIPQLYFDYLKTGDFDPLEGVLLHNRLDIVSLLFLLHATQKYLDDAHKYEYYSPQEAFLISRYLFRRRDFEGSCRAAAPQFVPGSKEQAAIDLGFHLGMVQKRLGRFEEALSTFRGLSKARGELRLSALESTAMLLEHQFRDFKGAEAVTLSAIEYLDSPIAEIPYDRVLYWNETLQKRRGRLLRKLK